MTTNRPAAPPRPNRYAARTTAVHRDGAPWLLLAAALLALTLALAAAGEGSAQTVPVGTPPNPNANQTSQLIWSAMTAAARAASTNPAAAQAANTATSAAIERYRMHDIAGARSAAIQALIEANQPTPSTLRPLQPVAAPPSYVQTAPPPLNLAGVAEVDADGFIAQARGSLEACRQQHSPNTNAATAQLVAASRDYQAHRFTNAQAEAKKTIDLCAPSLRAINLRTP